MWRHKLGIFSYYTRVGFNRFQSRTLADKSGMIHSLWTGLDEFAVGPTLSIVDKSEEEEAGGLDEGTCMSSSMPSRIWFTCSAVFTNTAPP